MKRQLTCMLLASLAFTGSAFGQSYTAQSFSIDGNKVGLSGLNNLGQLIGTVGPAGNVRGVVSAPNAGEFSFLTPAAGSGLSGTLYPSVINDRGEVAGIGKVPVEYLSTDIGSYGTPSTTTVVKTTTSWAFVAGTDLSARTVEALPAQAANSDVVPRQLVTGMNIRGEILIEQYPANFGSGFGTYKLASPTLNGGYASQSLSRYILSSRFSSLTGINDSGQIATFNYSDSGTVIEPGLTGFQNVPQLMGVQWAGLEGINASGQTIGSFNNPDKAGPRVFFADAGFTSWKELFNGLSPKTAPGLYGLNDAGQVIGSAYTGVGSEYRAFVTGPQGEGFIDLNTLVSLPAGEYLKAAYDINNLGQILASSNLGTNYLLTPSAVPEPGTVGLMAMGLLAVLLVRRKAIKA